MINGTTPSSSFRKLIFPGVGVQKEYVIQVRENIFVEADLSKRCVVYPNPSFVSYRECDDQFMRDFVSTFEPSGLVPVWLTDDLDKVTRSLNMTNMGELLHFAFFRSNRTKNAGKWEVGRGFSGAGYFHCIGP